MGKKIFLIDGVGAVISSLCLGLLLPTWQAWIGMPLDILHGLSLMAATFAAYSLSCYLFADHENPRWVTVIIAFNLAYGLLSLSLLALFWSELRALGITYFLAEKVIVLGIVALEWQVLTRGRR